MPGVDNLCHGFHLPLMATMNISLPATMRDFVNDQVAQGVYANASDFIRDVIRDRMWTPEALLAELEAGEASPDSEVSARESFAAFRRERVCA